MRPDDLVRVGKRRRIGQLLNLTRTHATVRIVCAIPGQACLPIEVEAVYPREEVEMFDSRPRPPQEDA